MDSAMDMNPQVQLLNNIIKNANPAIFNLLSEKGQHIFFPQTGILAQSAEAKTADINATIGIALEDDKLPVSLKSISEKILLNPKDIFPYAGSFGRLELRQAWKKLMFAKNPSLPVATSLPIVTSGVTHGLSLIGYLFLNPGNKIILPDKFWGNYKLIFTNGFGAELETFNTFKNNGFDIGSLKNKLTEKTGKKILLLNFPNNPSGYTPTPQEAAEIIALIKTRAEAGDELLIIIDDAYFGLVYEDNIYKESLFSQLSNLHKNVLAVKLDGATKEDYVWGLRVGFVTYGSKNLTAEACQALENKTAGAIRGNISNACHLSQSLILQAIESPSYFQDKQAKYELLKSRYLQVKTIVANSKYAEFFTALPFNSGYFMCLELKPNLDAEIIRQQLLQNYSTGLIATDNILRLAFSAVAKNKIGQLFENIYQACQNYNSHTITKNTKPELNFALKEKINELLNKHQNIYYNPSRSFLIEQALNNKEALLSSSGALATWTPSESTGRSPQNTYIVKHPESEHKIDWQSPANNPLSPRTFDIIFAEAIQQLAQKDSIYTTNKVIGADTNYALPTKIITDKALFTLFANNMLCPVPDDIANSIFYSDGFTLLVLPYDKLRPIYSTETLQNMVIAMDMDRKLGVVYGSAYCGSVKKLLFTVMNYLLPEKNILPLHCAANENDKGEVALFLGLSGTGKTTLSTDPTKTLIGDDEHGWSNEGVFNFENGCYAKLLNLDPKKEPEIHRIVTEKRPYLEHGCIVENTMMYPNNQFDFADDRFTPNSRVSYPLTCLQNHKACAVGPHPKTIIFLTADAHGVLPPVAKLNPDQAMLWFLMGYTSKLAGTETGTTEPQTVFSRFFGEPFMPRNPIDYSSLLGEKIQKYKADVYLVNTGWSGGHYGTGSRMDINITRTIIKAALNGALKNTACQQNDLFHFNIPQSCPGVDAKILNPKNTWLDPYEYEQHAKKLAQEFSQHFDRVYGGKNISEDIKRQCPGK